ncbi:ATP-grasp domain-containing protein [Archangium lansingense]|uniref:ATP-grasp domain-containing protein n=1 Tax=Archangium lansingense TaxID=2995310 RepID=A0ABT3ZVX8_9BACT|nr:ATP-grasp domain-containing protein [Archangium lansinium]MCY1073558.1 ATP-grasp domain-containing protein [Archangium lansinium]
MRICVLLSPYDEEGASPLTGLDPTLNPERWLQGHEVDTVLVRKGSAAAQLQELAGKGYDVFLNLCDGSWYEGVAGVEVVEELERLGLPFTGTSSRLYTLTKEQMKQAAAELGVATPAFVFAQSDEDIERAARTLRFPLIVKHFDGCGSLGMTQASCVREPGQLMAQARQMIAQAGRALLEEFIEGEEYTVLVAENPEEPGTPLVFTPVACVFPPGETFKHFELKWQSYEGIGWQPCKDMVLAARLQELTRRVFVGIQGVSYSRCDFRVDARGEPWFLEINTNCGIFYPPSQEGSADMILKHDPIGHKGFAEHILRCAIVRRQRQSHM